VLLAIILVGSADAQVDTAWARVYDGGQFDDEALGICADGDGYVYATGYVRTPAVRGEITTTMLAPNGDTLWMRFYPGAHDMWSEVRGRHIATDGAQNVYVAGEAAFATEFSADIIILKYDSQGVLLWDRNHNGSSNNDDEALDIGLDADTNVYVTGVSRSTGQGDDMVTVKYDKGGTHQWTKTLNGLSNSDDRAEDLCVGPTGNIYVVGTTQNAPSDKDVTTIKYLPNGDTAWVRHFAGFPGSEYCGGWGVTADDIGNVFVVGYIGISLFASRDFLIIKYNSQGDTVWTQTYDGPAGDRDEAVYVELDETGNVVVVGPSKGSTNPTGWMDYLTLKCNPNGDTLWSRRYNSTTSAESANDIPYDLAVDTGGNIYVSGTSDHDTFASTEDDILVVKYSPDGDQLWEARFNSPGNVDDDANAMFLDEDLNVYVAASTEGYGGEMYDQLMVKFVQEFCECPFQCDYDEDGFLTNIDLAALIDVLFRGEPTIQDPGCPVVRGDFNNDTFPDNIDLSGLIDHLFVNGDPPCDPCNPVQSTCAK
jgi:hypothetical protein